jgi:DNA-binding LacI/PurR family transcriptional regulator
MTTRREVADAAGVSVRTVSNVVNDFTHIAPATRERVLAAMIELDYRPNELARFLKVGRSGLVGLMLPELDTPYFAELTRTFVDEGYERGLTVVVQSNGDADRERAAVARTAKGGLFDAFVLSPLALRSEDIAPLAGNAPVVLLGETPFPGFDKVMVDSAAAGRRAVEHLLARGARRIAAVGSIPGDPGTSIQRYAGYAAALTAAGIEVDPLLVGEMTGFHRATGAAAMHDILDRTECPDAVFAFSDPLAHGVMRALHERGFRVPDDVLVVGFDDDEEGLYSIPTLSTISPDKQWLARTALDRVVGRLSAPDLPPETFLGPFRLEVRESTTRP